MAEYGGGDGENVKDAIHGEVVVGILALCVGVPNQKTV
jgi:hypothetical protein